MSEDILQQILSKLGEIQFDLDVMKKDVKEMKKELKAHQIEADDNFTKLYDAVSDKEIAINVLTKRVFGAEKKPRY